MSTVGSGSIAWISSVLCRHRRQNLVIREKLSFRLQRKMRKTAEDYIVTEMNLLDTIKGILENELDLLDYLKEMNTELRDHRAVHPFPRLELVPMQQMQFMRLMLQSVQEMHKQLMDQDRTKEKDMVNGRHWHLGVAYAAGVGCDRSTTSYG